MFNRLRERFRKAISGHISIGPLTIYGNNAMHFTAELWVGGFAFCFRPPQRRGWYFLVSPNHTPWAAIYAAGPGVERDDKLKAQVRRNAIVARLYSDWWQAPGEDAKSLFLRLMSEERAPQQPEAN